MDERANTPLSTCRNVLLHLARWHWGVRACIQIKLVTVVVALVIAKTVVALQRVFALVVDLFDLAHPVLSTDLSDISEVEYRQLRLERVVLCSVWTQGTAADPTDQLTYLARVSAIGVHPDQIGHRRSRSGHR
jgi:hypothetical protein